MSGEGNKNQQGEQQKENLLKKMSLVFEGEYKFWGEIIKLCVSGFALAGVTQLFQVSISAQQDKANQLKYEQGLVNEYIENVKGLLLKDYHTSSQSADPEITHADIANFIASKTSSLLKSITDSEQRQRLINFLKYSSIATIPEYRYSLYFPDNICSRVSRVKSKYYVDFLCTLNLTSDQKRDDIKNTINDIDKVGKLDCLRTEDKKNRTDLVKINMSGMILEGIDFRGAILDNALFDNAQLDHAGFGDALLDQSNFFNTDLQYANMNCTQLKKAKFSNSFMKGAILSNADLSGAEIIGTNLRDANLYRANLSSAYLGVSTELYENKTPTRNITDLRNADLEQANLEGAKLIKVDLRGAKNLHTITQLKGIECENSIINRDSSYNDLSFRKNCQLKVIAKKENLENANLSGFDLSGEDLRETILNGADLRKTDLRGVNLKGIVFDNKTCFKDAIYNNETDLPDNFKIDSYKMCEAEKGLELGGLVKIAPDSKVREHADLTFVNLQYANLSNSNLTSVDLPISNLGYARLFHVTLTGAFLKNANLTGANLKKAILIRANLTGANLIESSLRDADLTRANLQEAMLMRADLRGALLSQAILERLPKLDDAIYDDKTELPFSDKIAKIYGMWKIAPGSDLKRAILRGVDLRHSDLCDSKIDDKTRLDNALFNEETRLPEKITEKKCVDGKYEMTKEIIRKAQNEYNMVFIPIRNKWEICTGQNRETCIVKLQRANLPGVEFTNADLSGADLSGANLRGTYWTADVNLKGTQFKGTDLRNATFEEVDLSGVNFAGADLRGTDLSRAIYPDPSREKLVGICYDKRTHFPKKVLKQIPESVCEEN